MKLPTSVPQDDPSGLWWMQQLLLGWAERLIGKRDEKKKIYQPDFHENGPHICNTPSRDGAFVHLGDGSKTSWPIVVYEMAHETIHLLNPVAGYTNWLEEGVAVEFSLHALREFCLPMFGPPPGAYQEALGLVRSLPDGTFRSAFRVREVVGSLNFGVVSFEQLQSLFPGFDPKILRKLSEQCIPR